MAQKKIKVNGPDGYLVILRHEVGDMPVAFFHNYREACLYAEALDPMPTKSIRRLYGTDCSTPVSVLVIAFQNGTPKECVASIEL